MSDWFVSSAAYAAIAAFVASHAYSIGDIVKPTAPALKARWVFRCTTAGTSSTEPTWPSANNATITTGGATFTNVTGQSTYFWSAAAGDLATIMTTSNRLAGGDRIFISSDHAETQTTLTNYGTGTSGPNSFSAIQYICVNRAGSTPPAAADVTTGASVTVSTGTTLTFQADSPCYYTGITWVCTGTQGISFNLSSKSSTQYFQNCQLWLNSASAIRVFATNVAQVVLDNTICIFGAATQNLLTYVSGPFQFDFTWQNTPSAVSGTTPTTLFLPSTTAAMVTCRGVDLSAVTGTLVSNSGVFGSKYLFDSCRIAAGVVRYSTTSVNNMQDVVELVNCYDGTNVINERYQPAGSVVTERTITLSGGATDDVGVFSHKLVSGTNVDKYVNPLLGFWMDVENTVVGSSKTATVEIISSLTLNNDDISLLLEYQGTAGSSVASFVNTLPANILTTNAAVTASTATWNSQPATPQKQKLVVTFTPQVAGRVRGQVRLGAASTTVYVNPVVTIA